MLHQAEAVLVSVRGTHVVDDLDCPEFEVGGEGSWGFLLPGRCQRHLNALSPIAMIRGVEQLGVGI